MIKSTKKVSDYTHPDILKRIPKIETISECLNYISQYNDKIAIQMADINYSYKTLLDDVSKTRHYFLDQGFKQGDHIGLLLNNTYDFARLYLSITSLGMVAVVMPPQVYGKLDLLGMKNSLKFAVISRTIEKNPETKLPCVYPDEVKSTESADAVFVEPNTKCTILLSSGTSSGIPKSVLLSHKNIMTGTNNGVQGMSELTDHRYYVVIPFYHVFGLVRSFLTPLLMGHSMLFPTDVKKMFVDMAKFKPTFIILVPALADMIANVMLGKGKEATGGALEYILTGGAFLTNKTIDKYRKLGITLFHGYGLTETSLLVTANPIVFEKPNSIGILYEGQEAKIEDGELLIKGDNIMLGYYNDEENNKLAFTEDGYFKTGDMMHVDDEGFLYINGRKDNMIVLDNGENVSPEYLEGLLNNSQFIHASMVYKIKTSNNLDVLKVDIVPNMQVFQKLEKTSEVGQILHGEVAKLNESLPAYMKLNQVEIMKEDFKRTPSMKMIRKK